MPSLQVRDLPENLFLRLKRLAKKENRSMAQETIVILKNALNYSDSRHKQRKIILDNIKESIKDDYNNLPSPSMLIREDRAR